MMCLHTIQNLLMPISPTRQWGYGMFDLQRIFDWIQQTYTPRINDDFEEYRVKNLFIRKPKDL